MNKIVAVLRACFGPSWKSWGLLCMKVKKFLSIRSGCPMIKRILRLKEYCDIFGWKKQHNKTMVFGQKYECGQISQGQAGQREFNSKKVNSRD